MEIDFVILADSAQAVGGKLYMLGGGWDVLTIRQFPAQHPFAVAIGVSVPWTETNQRRSLTIDITDEDGQEAAKMTGQLEVGRPVGLPAGQPQRVLIALHSVLRIERPGGYVVIANLEDEVTKRVPFRVIASPSTKPPPPQQPAQ